LTTDQAQKLSPEAVQQLATHAQNSNPTIVESVSTFYAQHTTLIKTLGGTALTVALAKVAERQKQAWKVLSSSSIRAGIKDVPPAARCSWTSIVFHGIPHLRRAKRAEV